MRILVYGFEPYLSYKENVTKKVLRKLRIGKNLIKIVFPVYFHKQIFLNKIRRVNPDIIVGLGQYSRGHKIRIERKAINLKRSGQKEKLKVIAQNKPHHYFLKMKLNKDANSWISYNSGDYVCNFSMYVISDYIRKRKTKYAFIHIPKDYSINKATRFVEAKLREIQKTAAVMD